MIKPPALVYVADNSGALIGGCIKIPKLSSRVGARPGVIITMSVKKNLFKKHITKKSRIIVKGQIVKAVLITSAKEMRRWGNFFMKSSLNTVVLINQYELPYGTRMLGPIFREVRQKLKYRKIVSLAKLII